MTTKIIKQHMILQLILASVSQALGESSNSTEYDCADHARCNESSPIADLIGIIAAAMMATLMVSLCFIVLSSIMSGECARSEPGLNNSTKDGMKRLLSRKEITKNARTIYEASKTKSVLECVPSEVLIKIAGFTGNPEVHNEKQSEKIAFGAIATDLEAGNKLHPTDDHALHIGIK